MGFPGGGEILAVLLVALVVFGPHKLPEIARQLGKALHDLRHMQETVKREVSEALKLDSSSTPPPSYAEYGLDEPKPLPADPAFDPIEPPSSSFN